MTKYSNIDMLQQSNDQGQQNLDHYNNLISDSESDYNQPHSEHQLDISATREIKEQQVTARRSQHGAMKPLLTLLYKFLKDRSKYKYLNKINKFRTKKTFILFIRVAQKQGIKLQLKKNFIKQANQLLIEMKGKWSQEKIAYATKKSKLMTKVLKCRSFKSQVQLWWGPNVPKTLIEDLKAFQRRICHLK